MPAHGGIDHAISAGAGSGRGADAMAEAGKRVGVAALGVSARNGSAEATGSERGGEAVRRLSWGQVAGGSGAGAGEPETRTPATSAATLPAFGLSGQAGAEDFGSVGGGSGGDVVALMVDPQQLFARPVGEGGAGDGVEECRLRCTETYQGAAPDKQGAYARVHVCMDVCAYVYMYACMYVCMYVRTYVRTEREKSQRESERKTHTHTLSHTLTLTHAHYTQLLHSSFGCGHIDAR